MIEAKEIEGMGRAWEVSWRRRGPARNPNIGTLVTDRYVGTFDTIDDVRRAFPFARIEVYTFESWEEAELARERAIEVGDPRLYMGKGGPDFTWLPRTPPPARTGGRLTAAS
jgi:hypothetical protein